MNYAPQLLDRFGLSLDVRTPVDLASRVEVIKRRDAFERNPAQFIQRFKAEETKIRRSVVAARKRLNSIDVPDEVLELAARLCMRLGTDGLRGELTLIRAARALASLEGAVVPSAAHLRRVAPAALRHRLRRNVLDDAASTIRVERAVDEVLVK